MRRLVNMMVSRIKTELRSASNEEYIEVLEVLSLALEEAIDAKRENMSMEAEEAEEEGRGGHS